MKNWPALDKEQVIIQGMPEKETKNLRLKKGFKVPMTTWIEIIELCEDLGIDADVILK